MAKPNFIARTDGNGRVRYFVDGAEHTLDEYVAKYTRYHGALPEIPVGLGGRAPDELLPVTKEEILQQELAKSKAEAEFLKAKIEELTSGGDAPEVESEDEEDAEVALVQQEIAQTRSDNEALKRQLRELQEAQRDGTLTQDDEEAKNDGAPV